MFLGLNLLDIIEDLRNEDDEDLIIQCNVFDDEKQEDDEDLAALKPSGIDISNTQEVFNALYEKVKQIRQSSTQTNKNLYQNTQEVFNAPYEKVK